MRILATLFLLLCLSINAATTSNFVATITVTNVAGTTNGQNFVVSGDTRTWTNSVFIPASQILTNNTLTGAGVNMIAQVEAHPFTGFSLSSDGSSYIALTTAVNVSRPTITISAGWGTLTWHTNYFGTGTVVRMPIESEPNVGQETNVMSQLAAGFAKSTNGISINTGGTNEFGHTVFDDPATNSFLFKDADGLTRGTFNGVNLSNVVVAISGLPSEITSVTIPMADWFTNNVADGASLTGATSGNVTNTGFVWIFADTATNCIRSRYGLPWDWSASAVRMSILALCTGTNSIFTTNVVFAIRAAMNDTGQSAEQPGFSSLVWTTNNIGIGANTNRIATTIDITPGGSLSAGKSILWEIQRIGSATGDTLTNSSLCVAEVKIYYSRTPTATKPTPTP